MTLGHSVYSIVCFSVCRYYLIDDLADAVERQLAKLKDEHEPFCRVPVITSPEEEHLIVSTASKVSYSVSGYFTVADTQKQ